MRNGWVETTLGEVARWGKGRRPQLIDTDGPDAVPYLTAQYLRGGPIEAWSRAQDAEAVRAQEGDSLVLWDGAGAGDVFVTPCAGAVASTMSLVTPTADIVSPAFLALALVDAAPVLKRSTRGTTVPHVDPEVLGGLPMLVPPMRTQLRIVDLLHSIDSAIACAREAARASTVALDSLLEDWLSEFVESSTLPLAALGSMGSGPSWQASDECDGTVEGAVPVLGITNSPVGDALDLSRIGWVTDLPAKTRRLTETSLLLIRTNGNRARIGNVYRVEGNAVGMAYSAFQIGIFPNQSADRDVIYWQLRAPSVQRAITSAASGTTGLGNIAISWLKSFELSWPGEADRRRLVESADALQAVRIAAARDVVVLTVLRRSLRNGLLLGVHEIPESYDTLLAEAASA